MFRFARNHHQTLSKNTKDPLHKVGVDLCIFREGLMMTPSESKHVAQGQ